MFPLPSLTQLLAHGYANWGACRGWQDREHVCPSRQAQQAGGEESFWCREHLFKLSSQHFCPSPSSPVHPALTQHRLLQEAFE